MPTYWVKSGTGGTDAGTSWANAAESIPGLMTAQAIAGGDIIYVHNTHNFVAGATITWTLPETGTGLVQVLCVDGGDATGASLVDGTVGNLATGAVENTNGNFSFTINTSGSSANSAVHVHGLTIKAGAAGNSSGADININNSNGLCLFDACTFHVDSTSSSALLFLGNSTSTGDMHFTNCVFKFGASSQGINVNQGHSFFRNCSVDSTGTAPTTLFVTSASRASNITCSACDWTTPTNVVSAASTGELWFKASNCAIGTPITGTHAGYGAGTYEFQACHPANGTNGADILSYFFENVAGTVQSITNDDATAIYLTTGGAQGEQDDGTDVAYSLLMQPTAIASKSFPLYTPWIYVLVGSTGDKTVTMKAADLGTDADELHTSEIWMEVEYMGEPGATGTQRVANSPMSIMEVDDDCNIQTGTVYRDVSAAGTDRTDTDDAWTGIAETNSYTFTASVNCAEVGYIRCRIGLAFDRDVYVDPKVNVA